MKALGVTLPSRFNDNIKSFAYTKDIFSLDECSNLIGKFSETEGNFINISFEESNDWIISKISDLVMGVNQKYFRFIIDSIQHIQIVKYKKADKINFHMDLGIKNNSTRKLTVISLLSSNCKDFKISFVSESIHFEKEGDTIVLPSYIPYSMDFKSNSDTYILVVTVHGPPFR